LGANVVCIFGDGSLGYDAHAPYDRIIVTAGAPEIPKELLNQLVVGGKMIVPVGNGKIQRMNIVERLSDTEYQTSRPAIGFSFVPLLGEGGWKAKSARES
jgi:protein-L-isoaspartate(D-aspartate) O-methyltransferase